MKKLTIFCAFFIVGIWNQWSLYSQQTSASPPYFTDFESGALSEWSNLTTDNSYPQIFTRFAGRYGNTALSLNLTNLNAGESYTLLFDFYALDSWDGGSDYFNISVNGEMVFHHSFNNVGGGQSYPGSPSNFGNFGFNSYNDAIYRTIAVVFTPTNTSATIVFQGQNLEAIDNESWGIDNVAVFRNSDQTYIASSSLPEQNSTNAVAIDTITLFANNILLNSSATNAANYELRSDGGNNVFDDSDDSIFTLTPQLNNNRQIVIAISPSPLQPGHYRFRVKSTLLDTN